jgi:hypothetical protein
MQEPEKIKYTIKRSIDGEYDEGPKQLGSHLKMTTFEPVKQFNRTDTL